MYQNKKFKKEVLLYFFKTQKVQYKKQRKRKRKSKIVFKAANKQTQKYRLQKCILSKREMDGRN